MANEIKQIRVEQAIRRRKIKWAVWILAGLGFLSLIIAGVFYYNKGYEENLPGQLIPDQGREHITTTTHPAYNSNPPTSGWHYPQPAEWGIYKEEIPDEVVIHNLEHGGVWLTYRPGISEEIVQKLEGFYKKYGRKIIVAPRSKNDSDISLAAWNRLDKFSVEEYSDERADKFIQAYRNKGPEFVP